MKRKEKQFQLRAKSHETEQNKIRYIRLVVQLSRLNDLTDSNPNNRRRRRYIRFVVLDYELFVAFLYHL